MSPVRNFPFGGLQCRAESHPLKSSMEQRIQKAIFFSQLRYTDSIHDEKHIRTLNVWYIFTYVCFFF